jgi:hypothetical protein
MLEPMRGRLGLLRALRLADDKYDGRLVLFFGRARVDRAVELVFL